MDTKSLSHTKWECQYHIVFIPKYRQKRLHVSIPPKYSVAEFMSYLKGKSALMLYDKHPEQRSKWDKGFWARGYYAATIGTISEETIKKYILEQAEEDKKEANSSKM